MSALQVYMSRSPDDAHVEYCNLVTQHSDLLVACEQLVSQLAAVAQNAHEWAAVEDGRAAIAKARGEAV